MLDLFNSFLPTLARFDALSEEMAASFAAGGSMLGRNSTLTIRASIEAESNKLIGSLL
jgi:hypothetical protein